MSISLYNEMDGTIASDAPERPLVAVAGPTGSGRRVALRAGRSPLGPDVRGRACGGGSPHFVAGLPSRLETVRIPRIQAGAAVDPGRAEPARGAFLRAPQHAELRQAPDHLVPKGAWPRVVERIRR